MGLAEAGAPDAQAYMGVLLAFNPNASSADQAAGCRYMQAASATRSDAMHFLGEAYQNGKCGPKNLQKAIETFRKAGDMGLAKSRCAEGNVRQELHGDAAGAARLCREAAEAGDADAQTDLGNFYLTGQGVSKDITEARRWYEKAATQGQRNAAFTLGQIYWNGDGVKKDNATAARWWRQAHSAGRREAALLLGDEAFVRAALGTSPDLTALTEACQWYEEAVGVVGDDLRSRAIKQRDLCRALAKARRELATPP